MPHVIDYRGANSDRGPSPNLWHDCDWLELVRNPNKGVILWDDFASGGLITSPTTEAALVGIPYIGFGSAGSTIVHADEVYGAVALATAATDNLATYIKSESHPFKISAALGKLWFEARVKLSTITDDACGFVVGLMDTTALTVVVPLSTADPPVLSACNFVGFHGPEEDAGLVNAAYIANGVAPVEPNTGVHQLVVSTYVKLGMKFDPGDPDGDNKLAWFVNGVQQTTKKTIPDDTGDDFPADVRLAPVAGIRNGAGTAHTMTMDWWRCAQLTV